MKKRILSLLLCLMLCLSLMPTIALAADIASGTGWKLSDDGVLHITGAVPSGGFGLTGEQILQVESVVTTLGASISSGRNLFYGYENMTSADLSNLDTSSVTDMSYMFYGCSSLTSLDVSGFDTSSVTDMNFMFTGCTGLISLGIRYDILSKNADNIIAIRSPWQKQGSTDTYSTADELKAVTETITLIDASVFSYPEGPTVVKDSNSPTGYTVHFVYKNAAASSVYFVSDCALRNDIDPTDTKIYTPFKYKPGLMRSASFEQKMLEIADGYWYISVPMAAGANSYWFYLDGDTNYMAPDPANHPIWSPSSPENKNAYNTVYVPYDEEKQNYEPMKDRAIENPRADHKGTWSYVSYSDGDASYFFGVYLPYGYDPDRAEPYKTIYLLHGGGQNESDWMGIGSVPNIMDNMIADGKCEPAVVITLNTDAIGNSSSGFAQLFNGIIPFVEGNYNVSNDKMDRALGGLSMGSLRTMDIINSDPRDNSSNPIGKFGYYGTWSGGNSVRNDGFPGQEYSHIMFGGGKNDFGNPSESSIKLLADHGAFCKYVCVAGAHDFNTWSQLFRIWLEDYLWNPEAHGDVTATYTITVENDGNGTASADKASAAKGETVTLTATPNTGYHFKEWQSSDVTVSGNTFTMPEKDVTVKAIFEENTYTITVENDGNGSASADKTSAAKGDTVTLTATPNTGYHFKEWQSSDVTVTGNTFTMPENDVIIKAIFEEDAPTTYTVSFNMNSHGTQVADQTVEDGNKATKPADPTASGWTFGGWYADATFSARFDFNAAITANTTIYAKWTENTTPPAPTYTIIAGANSEWTKGSTTGLAFTSDAPFDKFDSVKVDGSTIAAANYTAEEGSTKITLAPAYLETLSVDSHSIVVVSTDGTASTNFTVKAAAQPPVPAKYTVSFNMNGHGTQVADQTVEDGNKATKPADPKASGYTFGGWYADATFSTKFDFNTAITANTTVYAKWTKNSAAPADPTSPQTGDTSNMFLWIALLLVSGGALVGTTVYGRKKKYNAK